MGYIGLFFSPIQMLSIYWTSYKSSQASFDRIGEIFSLKKEIWGVKTLPSHIEKIDFEKIHFTYDNRVIFHDFSATFLRGMNYITGENGSGKSTLIRLLCGLYRPDKGRILIDRQDITSLSRESLRQSVSMVFPDALIFDGSICENILIGDISASREDVVNAAKKAELDTFVSGLPDMYDTAVGEAGLNLSSGEKQKIALARVILRNSPIIVFDEFTRSIDIDSKRSILSVIRKMDDKIVIIITHDRSEIESGCNLVEIGRNHLPTGNNGTGPGKSPV
jgi:ABC-type multidrug transport system fused ATPase/permease subunit